MKQFIYFSACVCLILSVLMIGHAQKPELVVASGHSNSVSSVAFSPDGKTLASGSDDGTIKLWDVSTGKELRTLIKHAPSYVVSPEVRSVAFSPDAKTIASGGGDATIKLWDVSTGAVLHTLEGNLGWVDSVAFSPDGKTLASGSRDGVRLWDISTGKELRSLEGDSNPVRSVAFSPDGRILASGSSDGVKLRDVSTGADLLTLKGHPSEVFSVTFSPDEKTLASGGGYGVKLWDVSTGAELHTLKGHSNGVSEVAFNHDGKTLVSGGWDNTIKLWDVSTGAERRILKGHSDGVATVAWSPDRETLASGSNDRTIKLWNVSSGAELHTFKTHSNRVNSVAFSPDGKTLTSGGWDTTLKVWDVSTDSELRTFKRYSPLYTSVALGSDGKPLADRGSDVTIVALSPDGKIFASGHSDGTIELWDISRNAKLFTLRGHSSHVRAVAFSPDGKTLASGGNDGVKLWDFSIGSQLRALEDPSGSIRSVAFSPDGKTLASGGTGQIVKLWDVSTGAQLRTLKGHSNSVESIAFSPVGTTLASGSSEGAIKLWDLSNGRELHTLIGHSNSVLSLVFSPNNKYLASGSDDTSIKVWETSSGKELASLIAFDEQDWIVLTPDGFFDGSPPAWNKVLWRYNNNTFDVTPVEAYFAEFYYPGLLTDIFAGKRLPATAQMTNKDRRQIPIKLTAVRKEDALAPITSRTIAVQIEVEEAPDTDTNPATAGRGTWWPPSGARDIRLFRNGSLVKIWRGDVFALGAKDGCTLQPRPNGRSASRSICTKTIPIVAGPNNFTAYVFNRDNIKSSDARLTVTGADTLRRQGTAYILAVGVNSYRNPRYNLKYAVADALEFSAEVKLRQELLKQYDKVEVIPLHDDVATKQNILAALRLFSDGSSDQLPSNPSEWLKRSRKAEPEDAVIIFFAGHGTAKDERFYLLPHDFVADNEEQLKATAVSDVELNELLERVDAGRLLMVIDACQSGQALGGEKEGRGPMNSKGLAQLAYDKGMYILTAAQSFQAALEVSRSQVGQKIEHGLLTFALLEGLSKGKKDIEGNISERTWMNFAVEQVPLMQIEEMKKRNLENKIPGGQGQRGAELIFVLGDKENIDPEKRNVQRPRVFYRRELEAQPLIVAKQ